MTSVSATTYGKTWFIKTGAGVSQEVQFFEQLKHTPKLRAICIVPESDSKGAVLIAPYASDSDESMHRLTAYQAYLRGQSTIGADQYWEMVSDACGQLHRLHQLLHDNLLAGQLKKLHKTPVSEPSLRDTIFVQSAIMVPITLNAGCINRSLFIVNADFKPENVVYHRSKLYLMD